MSGCCGLGSCTDPKCYLCHVVAKLPQQSQRMMQGMEPKKPKPKKEK